MNETNIPPQLPPQLQPPPITSLPRQLGDDPGERVPVAGIASAIESILRQPRRVMFQLHQPNAGRIILTMLFLAMVCALIYGVVVGTFSGGTQYWAAPVKIAGGLLIATAICLPSLYIFTCLSGSQAQLVEVFGLVAGLLMLMTLLLIGFAPVAWLFSESTNSVAWMGALHLLFWLIATAFGLRFLGAGFAQTQAKSKLGLRIWAVIFVLVALQMTTTLRPIVGTADTLIRTEKKLFIHHWFDCLGKAEAGRKAASYRE